MRAQKLNQQPAVTYDTGNRDFVIKRNKVNTSAAVDLTLKMTSAQVVETSVNVISNSPSQDYTHPHDRSFLNYDIFFVALLFLRGLNIHDKRQAKHCFYMGRSRMSSPYHTS